MKEFKISDLGPLEGGAIHIALEGQIGITEAAEVSKYFEGLLAKGTTWLVVSLKGIDFISTAGVGALLYAVGGARKNGGEIIFIEFSPKTKAVFEFLDLHDFIVTAPDLEQGVVAAKDIKSGARPRIT